MSSSRNSARQAKPRAATIARSAVIATMLPALSAPTRTTSIDPIHVTGDQPSCTGKPTCPTSHANQAEGTCHKTTFGDCPQRKIPPGLKRRVGCTSAPHQVDKKCFHAARFDHLTHARIPPPREPPSPGRNVCVRSKSTRGSC